MKVLYVTVGAPGSGKTHFVDSELGELDNVHSDRVRDLVEGYKDNVDEETGKMYKSHNMKLEKKTWALIWDLIEQRMDEGKTFVFDSTFLSKKSFSTLKNLREKYNYRVYALDFTGVPLEQLTKNNQTKERIENYAVVPDEVLLDMYNRAQNIHFPSWINVLNCVPYKEGVRNVYETLKWVPTDVSSFNKVKVIGDIHGSATVLEENVLSDVDPNILYVFLGDYLDRGTENAKTFKLLYNHVNDPNFIFLRGNHDRHLEHFVQGNPINNSKTESETIPELLESGVTKKDIKRFVKKLQDVFIFEFNGRTYVCSHAGLLWNDVERLLFGNGVLIDQYNFVDGVGKFNNDVDYWYDYEVNQALAPAIQIHGHRNEFNTLVDDYETIYNLDQRVERGGHLAVVEMDTKSIKTHMYKNDHYDVRYLETDLDTDISELSNQDIKKVLEHSKSIQTKQVEDNLFANNFTRKAFAKNNFNNFSIQARGLFTDQEGNVLGRGFKKFFNIDQTPETTEEAILAHPLPVRVSEKIDGFLVILTSVDGQLKVLSKGGSKEFGNEGKRILMKQAVSSEKEIASFLESKNISVVCEVVSSRDSHVINYNEDHIYVLDAIYNDYPEYADIQIAKDFSKKTGLEMPDETIVDEFEVIEEAISELREDTYPLREGVVLTFDDGFRVKIKNHAYFAMKSLLNEISKKRKYSNYTFEPFEYYSKEENEYMKYILGRVSFGDNYEKTPMGFEDNKATEERYGIPSNWVMLTKLGETDYLYKRSQINE